MNFTMKSVSGCVCVHGQVEKEGDESGMSLGGEGMCTDGTTEGLEELRKYYVWIDKQNEVGKEQCVMVYHVILLRYRVGYRY